jgi:hypothetical protein
MFIIYWWWGDSKYYACIYVCEVNITQRMRNEITGWVYFEVRGRSLRSFVLASITVLQK